MPTGNFKNYTFKPTAGISAGIISYDYSLKDGAASMGLQTPEFGGGLSFVFDTKEINPSGNLYSGGLGWRRLGFSWTINVSSTGVELAGFKANLGFSVGSLIPFHLSVPEQGAPCSGDDPYQGPMF